MSEEEKKRRRCIGFGDKENVCREIAGTPWTKLWCAGCDANRRQHLDRQFTQLAELFEAKSTDK